MWDWSFKLAINESLPIILNNNLFREPFNAEFLDLPKKLLNCIVDDEQRARKIVKL